jgi:alginate O-acetyltransferase complex protein AlgI
VARSVTEFWRRWHISLSTWFRDYLYIPLGGNRGSPARTYGNLMVVFVLCGLWHGASASFLVWGLYHGLFLVIERVGLGERLERWPAWLRHGYLLLVVMVGWVFFRAETLGQAGQYLATMFAGGAPVELEPLALHVDPRILVALVAGVIGSIPWVPALKAWNEGRVAEGRVASAIAMETAGVVLLAGIFVASAIELATDSYNPFIYFRF